MNKQRRKALEKIASVIDAAKNELEEVMAEEEEYRDNIPENLQGSERYEIAEAACESLSDAIDLLDDAISSIENATE